MGDDQTARPFSSSVINTLRPTFALLACANGIGCRRGMCSTMHMLRKVSWRHSFGLTARIHYFALVALLRAAGRGLDKVDGRQTRM